MSSLFQRDGDAYDLKDRLTGCVAYNANAKTPGYGYDPHAAPGVIFTLVFGISALAHIVQSFRGRKLGYLTFAVGALGECLGWLARAAAHHCPYNKHLFSIQISILILAPCFFSAGIYYILSQLIRQYGRRYSLLPPNVYLIVFCIADIISIFVQAIGGAMAAGAVSKSPPGNPKPGTYVMLGGICFQLLSMSIFCILWLLFLFRARKVPYSRLFAFTTSLATAFIMVRNFYRAFELGQGWTGYLITHEVYFCVLDGGLMALATLIMNFFHPSGYVTGVPTTENTHSIDVKMASVRPSFVAASEQEYGRI